MKNYILFLFTFCVFYTSQAQLIEHKTMVFSSGASESTGGTMTNFGIVGQAIVGNMSGGNIISTEIGFIPESITDPIASLENELLSKQIALYPNPVKDALQIGGFPSEEVKAIIYNAQGKVVMPLFRLPQENTIDVSHLESGLYFLYLYDGKYKAIKKLQKR